MENNTADPNTTDPCDNRDCEGCIANPALLVEFKQAIHVLSGKWKLEILGTLMDGGVRFGALRRALAPITQHMLTAQLRELERDGLVSRKVLAAKPLQVAYELTDAAWGLLPAFRELLAWSKTYGPRRGAVASRKTAIEDDLRAKVAASLADERESVPAADVFRRQREIHANNAKVSKRDA